jgi:thymidylate synthase (FAD)
VSDNNLSNRVERPRVPKMDELLGQQFKVLNDGFVRIIDYMGNDQAIVQAARVSYGAGTKHVNEDRGLIRYLMRHGHTTPFEMCELKLHVRVPMDCWRQWIRHRTANVNEYSTRYSIAIDAAQSTDDDEWRLQSVVNRQGSGAFIDPTVGGQLSKRENELHALSREVYKERLEAGVAREQARKDLPLSTYTEAYWKIDLHNLLHFLQLRLDAHAQREIREYANVIGNEILSVWCPITWEAFNEYRLNSLALSQIESSVVRFLSAGQTSEALEYLRTKGILRDSGDAVKPSRELDELRLKLEHLGLPAPWDMRKK